jgi:hypothetical protein
MTTGSIATGFSGTAVERGKKPPRAAVRAPASAGLDDRHSCATSCEIGPRRMSVRKSPCRAGPSLREGDRLIRREGRSCRDLCLGAMVRGEQRIDLARAARPPLAIVEDRAVRGRGVREIHRGGAARRLLGRADQIDRSARAEEMGHVEIAGARLPPGLGRELVAVFLREGAGHHRGDLRVLAQAEDSLPQLRIRHRERAVGFRRDGAGVVGKPVLRPRARARFAR